MHVCTPAAPKDNPLENVTVTGYITEKPTSGALNTPNQIQVSNYTPSTGIDEKTITFDDAQSNKLKNSNTGNITINGKVKGSLGNNLENADVKFYNKKTMDLQNETYTDNSGDYNAQFLYVGQKEKKQDLEAKLYPNPSQGQTNISFNSTISEDLLLSIYNMKGDQVYKSTINAKAGENTTTITGGNTGMYVVSIIGEQTKQSFKWIQNSTTSESFSQNTKTNASNELNFKSALDNSDGLDSLYIVFSKNGYVTGDTTVAPIDQTVNKTLQQLPTTFDFTAYALTINGDTIKPGNAINTITVNAKRNSDNVNMQFTSDAQGKIHFYWQETTLTPTTSLDITNADTTTFCTGWIFGLKQDSLINVKEMNLFQSSKAESPTYALADYIPPGPATATLSTLPPEFDMYFMQRIVLAADGNPYHTEGEKFRKMANGQNMGGTRKYEEIPQVASKIFIYEMQAPDSINSGLPQITTQQSLDQSTALDSVQTLFYLHNGRQIFPHFERDKIYNSSNSTWVEGQNRGWDQTHKVQFISAGNPSNGLFFTDIYGIGGISRIKRGLANYRTNTSKAVKITEMIQSFTNSQDPGVEGSTPYFYSSTTGMSQYGDALFAYTYIAEPNSHPK